MTSDNEKTEWNTGCLKVIGIMLLSVLIIWIFVVDFKNSKNSRDSCEEIGGEYQVVGEEFSATLKRTVDIYGCVK